MQLGTPQDQLFQLTPLLSTVNILSKGNKGEHLVSHYIHYPPWCSIPLRKRDSRNAIGLVRMLAFMVHIFWTDSAGSCPTDCGLSLVLPQGPAPHTKCDGAHALLGCFFIEHYSLYFKDSSHSPVMPFPMQRFKRNASILSRYCCVKQVAYHIGCTEPPSKKLACHLQCSSAVFFHSASTFKSVLYCELFM